MKAGFLALWLSSVAAGASALGCAAAESGLASGAAPVHANGPLISQTQAATEEVPGSAAPVPDMGPLFAVLNSLSAEGWVSAPAEVFSPHEAPFVAGRTAQMPALLQEFRCLGVATRFFQRGQRLVVVRAFRFESSQGAYGAYTLMRSGSQSAVKRGDASSEDDQSLSFWQGPYFVAISTTSENDDEAKELILTIAGELSAGIGEHASLPALVSDLPALDRISGSERLVMGPVGARLSAPVPHLGALAIDKAQGAVSGEYQFREPNRERLRLLLVAYDSPGQAGAAYRQYLQTLEDHHESVESASGAKLFKLSDSYLLCQLRGNQVAVISGARRRSSPLLLSRQFNY